MCSRVYCNCVFTLPQLALCGYDALQRALLQCEMGQMHIEQLVCAVVEFSCLHQFVIPDVTMYFSFYITAYIPVHLEPINAWVLALDSGHNLLSLIWFHIGRIMIMSALKCKLRCHIFILTPRHLPSCTAFMPRKYWEPLDCELQEVWYISKASTLFQSTFQYMHWAYWWSVDTEFVPFLAWFPVLIEGSHTSLVY